jgi:NAD(P)-dependent dehydrogenase (short-subunit alcohol dehydrogenase family)
VVAIKADVSHQQDLHAMARLAVERHGRIDVLVNCAGVNVFRDPLQMTEEDWRRCLPSTWTAPGSAARPCCRR